MAQVITPVVLTPQEVAAGRVFRDYEQAMLDLAHREDPVEVFPPFTNATYRHLCPRTKMNSRSMALREVYRPSSAYWVSADLEATLAYPGQPPMEGGTFIPAGKFGFIYRQGSCNCGLRGRSKTGWFVDANRRPPMGKAVLR